MTRRTDTKQVILCRTDIKLPKGKLAAQASHASLGAVKSQMVHSRNDWILSIVPGTAMEHWWGQSWAKVALAVDSIEELNELVNRAKAAGLPTCIVTDSGRTTFHGVPTVTCAAIGPGWIEDIDKITGHLKLVPGK